MIPKKNEVVLCILSSDNSKSTDELILLAAKKSIGEEVGAIARTDRGKPYLPENPRLHLNVSHSGSYFVCAFSGSHVGVDIQEHTCLKDETPESAVPRLKKMARRFFHPSEADYINTDTYERFFRLWTAKESYVKLTGNGIDDDFLNLSVLPAEEKSLPEMSLSCARWKAADAYFYQENFDEGYTVCVCVYESHPNIVKCI